LNTDIFINQNQNKPMKNIAIFLDGTWNDREDPNVWTNVALLHEMSLSDPSRQITYYSKGVGTDGGYDMKLGGLHGVGLSKNVKKAYSFLVEHYEEGDKVFIFGFSRGAYTARSLAGLVFQCGVKGASFNISSDVDKIYDAYKDRDSARTEAYKAENKQCPIQMLGVWDTVGALGIPVSFLKKVNDKVFAFHDTKLNPEVQFACHAVAIDERRDSFEPTLWKVTPENKNRIKQVWFPGVHSDVGGGYEERHHSDIALRWMREQAKDRGLLIKEDHVYEFKDDLKQKPHDSVYKIFGIEIGEADRKAPITTEYIPRIHRSVLEKMKCSDYKPIALLEYLKDHNTLEPYIIEE
jgi:uncharacterized protein (DUF2235 family)